MLIDQVKKNFIVEYAEWSRSSSDKVVDSEWDL